MRDACLKFLLSLAAGLLLAALPGAVRGQAFAFSVGGGGGYHHHHHRGWYAGYSVGPWWGPGWYGPPPVVYAPPPVVQERVIYVQPQTAATAGPPAAMPYSTSATGSTGAASGAIAPSPALPSLAANSRSAAGGSVEGDDRIVIRNAAGVNLPVSFVVDGQDVDLTDGATRTFIGKSRRVVQYDRGGRYGSTQQDVTGGQYEFRVTASGWDLVRKADIVPGRTAVRANSLPGGVSR